MALVRVPSSDELYAAGLLSGKAYVCRFLRCCQVTGRQQACVVVPSDMLRLDPDTVVEDVHMKVRVRVRLIIDMTARGLVTPMYLSSAFNAWAPQTGAPLPKAVVVRYMTPMILS